MAYFAAALLGYLLGCSNMALYLAKWKRLDLRSSGSGNLGASNAAITMGWWAGIVTAVHDAGKALLAVWLTRWLLPEAPWLDLAAGAACVIGHIFPVFLRFRGGKGLASYMGMLLALDWRLMLAVMGMLVVITVVTDYLVIGTVAAAVLVPVALGLLEKSWWPVLILGPLALVILVQHRANYVRILRGTEIGLRATIRGEGRKEQPLHTEEHAE